MPGVPLEGSAGSSMPHGAVLKSASTGASLPAPASPMEARVRCAKKMPRLCRREMGKGVAGRGGAPGSAANAVCSASCAAMDRALRLETPVGEWEPELLWLWGERPPPAPAAPPARWLPLSAGRACVRRAVVSSTSSSRICAACASAASLRAACASAASLRAACASARSSARATCSSARILSSRASRAARASCASRASSSRATCAPRSSAAISTTALSIIRGVVCGP